MATDKKRINAYLDHDLEEKAKKLAAANKMSLSTLIAFLLNQAVESQKIQIVPTELTEAPVEPSAKAELTEAPAEPLAAAEPEVSEDIEAFLYDDEEPPYDGPEDDPAEAYYEAMANAPDIPGMREHITKKHFPNQSY